VGSIRGKLLLSGYLNDLCFDAERKYGCYVSSSLGSTLPKRSRTFFRLPQPKLLNSYRPFDEE